MIILCRLRTGWYVVMTVGKRGRMDGVEGGQLFYIPAFIKRDMLVRRFPELEPLSLKLVYQKIPFFA